MYLCPYCPKEAKSKAGLSAHVRGMHQEELTGKEEPNTEAPIVEEAVTVEVQKEPKPVGNIKVGDVVYHKLKGDKFQVAEINKQGLIGRKVNNRDPYLYYKPTELYIK